MIWYLTDTARFAAEQEALRALERGASWLSIGDWRLDDGMQVCVDVDLTAGGSTTPLTLRYGQTFPFTAPSVLPTIPKQLSGHQYGNGGELCLEWGPDNWRPELTGADMLISAERLLSGEAAGPDERPGLVTSRHKTTRGQDTRTVWGRLLVTQSLAAILARLTPGTTAKATFLDFNREDIYLVAPVALDGLAEGLWMDPEVPAAASGLGVKIKGQVFILPSGVTAPKFEGSAALRTFLTEHGHIVPEGYEPDTFELILVWGESGARMFWLGADDALYDFTVFVAEGGQRLGADHSELGGKTVGLVGCGSAGSKLAVSLARAGVRKFVLIDDDVLLPENLVRNDLDWVDMGSHKAVALARRLDLAAPGTTCTIRKQRIGGQEANGSIDGALHLLQQCDLIVDATADARAFNLLSSVVHVAGKPLVWLEVFAGGIGGLIARSRPSLDPAPQAVRARIEAWCQEQGVTAPRPVAGYGVGDPAAPLIADDADVGVIAAHAARFCIDLLIGRSPSAFPASAYLIGLSDEWLFSQPFHTIPLDVGPPPAPAEQPAANSAGLAAIFQLFKDRSDQAPAAS